MKRAISLSTLVLLLAFFGLAPDSQAQNAPIRSGDTIEVRIAGVPPEEVSQFNQVYNVDENGMVNLPYLGLIRVEGQQANQVQRSIEEKLIGAKIYTKPTITVTLQNATRLVNVGGPGVRSPQRVTYTPDLTLMTAINAAGGFNDFADRKRVTLIRDGKTATYDVRQLLKDPSKDPAVKPGDQITVPMSLW